MSGPRLRWQATPNGQFWLLHLGSLPHPVVTLQRSRDGAWLARCDLGTAGPILGALGGLGIEVLKGIVAADVALWLAAMSEPEGGVAP